VGVDTGGTFTDLIAFVDGRVRTLKLLSSPSDPAQAVLSGLQQLLPEVPVGVLTYGSTVATNALLQRRGARVVLLTTAGFDDLIEIGHQNRPALYDLEPHPPEPLVTRSCRVGVDERMLADGHALLPLRWPALQTALRAMRAKRPEAVAVCFLHSYANAAHEEMGGTACERWPELFVSVSNRLSAEHREYERLSATVINAYVGPIMSRHLRQLEDGLRAFHSGGVRPRVMQSNGGSISAQLASREAVRTVLSGPAAGVAGAWAVARTLGLRRVIAFDMGGTFTDVSLADGRPGHRSEFTVAGLPLRLPAIDIHTVGAGGGSIARVDVAGALKVGPESAGADPGPACYGRGQLPTVTDANVVLGRVLPKAFLGGRMLLQPERSARAIATLGKRLRLSREQAAEGVVRVVNAAMERAIRTISVERGYEPRGYALIAFRGAGGQHACELAALLGIRRVIVPRDPGLLSARGAASADLCRDYVRTVILTAPPPRQLLELFASLERQAREELQAEGVASPTCLFSPTLDVRYRGQSHELTVPFRTRFEQAFHAAHQRLYGYRDTTRPIEVVSLRLLAVARGPRPRQEHFWPEDSKGPAKTQLYWNGHWRSCLVYAREGLKPGRSVRGAAIVTELSATTVIPPGWVGRVHPGGHLDLTHAH